jgi:predicted GNAT family acetyltransferase
MEEIKVEINQHGDGAFYLFQDNNIAGKMLVGITGNALNAYHTEALIEGKGFAKKLVAAMVAYAREHHLKVTPYCPYVHAQFKRHPEQYDDIWDREKGQKHSG